MGRSYFDADGSTRGVESLNELSSSDGVCVFWCVRLSSYIARYLSILKEYNLREANRYFRTSIALFMIKEVQRTSEDQDRFAITILFGVSLSRTTEFQRILFVFYIRVGTHRFFSQEAPMRITFLRIFNSVAWWWWWVFVFYAERVPLLGEIRSLKWIETDREFPRECCKIVFPDNSDWPWSAFI